MNLNIHLIKIKDPELTGFELSTSLVESMGITFDEATHLPNWEKIQTQANCAKNEILTFFKDKSPVESIRFGMSTARTAQYDEHTPIAEVETNKATYMVIFSHLRFGSGTLFDNNVRRSNYEPEVSLGNPVVFFILEEAAKALIGAAVERAFDSVFPKENDVHVADEVKQIKEDLEAFLKEEKIEDLEDRLVIVRKWLRDTYMKSVEAHQEGQKIPTENIYNDLKNNQTKLQEITSILEDIDMSSLSQCDYLTRRKCMLYAACASFRLVIMREQQYMQDILVAEKHEEYNNDVLKKEMASFLQTTSSNISKYEEALRLGRMHYITGVTAKSETTKTLIPDTHPPQYTYYTWNWYEWEDRFRTTNSKDPFGKYQNKLEKENYKEKTDKDPGNEAEVKARLQTNNDNYKKEVLDCVQGNVSQLLNEALDGIKKFKVGA